MQKLKNQERLDWIGKIELNNRELENHRISEIIGDEPFDPSNPFMPNNPWNYDTLNEKDFGEWEKEGRYINLFGDKLPLPKYSKGWDGKYKETESRFKGASILNMVGDEWLSSKGGRLSDRYKNVIKASLNQSAPGLAYGIAMGENMYDVDMNKLEGGFTEAMLGAITALADPLSIGSMIFPYALGGRLAVSGTTKGLQLFNNSFYKGSKLQQWFGNATGKRIIQGMPNGKGGVAIKNKLQNILKSDGFYKTIYGVGGFGTLGTWHSTQQSR